MPKFSADDFLSDLNQVILFCKKFDLRFALIGGIVLGVWGRPRSTVDLDFLLLTSADEIKKIRASLIREGFTIDRFWEQCNPLLRNTHVRVVGKAFPIDLMIPHDAHERQLFKRSRRKKLGVRMIPVVSPEDFVLQKLKVGRPHDFEDALTVLERMRGKLDLLYLQSWARKLGLEKELHYIQNL